MGRPLVNRRIRDMAHTALEGVPPYNPTMDPMAYNMRLTERPAGPPHKVTEPAAVSVTISATSFGSTITAIDRRNDTEN
jgi:hypothetical protein